MLDRHERRSPYDDGVLAELWHLHRQSRWSFLMCICLKNNDFLPLMRFQMVSVIYFLLLFKAFKGFNRLSNRSLLTRKNHSRVRSAPVLISLRGNMKPQEFSILFQGNIRSILFHKYIVTIICLPCFLVYLVKALENQNSREIPEAKKTQTS